MLVASHAFPHLTRATDTRPRSNGAATRLPDLGQRLRLRRLVQPVQHPIAIAHPEIVDRQHVRPTEREDQQHFDRPPADAANRGQPLDQCLIRQPRRTTPRRHCAVQVAAQIARIAAIFDAGEAARTQLRLRTRQHQFGRRERLGRIQRLEPRQDRQRRTAVQLLVSDRTHQRLVRAASPLNTEPRRSDPPDQCGKRLVAPEVAQRIFNHGQRLSWLIGSPQP